MSASGSAVKSGVVIFRHWDEREGLSEVARSFATLDEMFRLCLMTDKEKTLLVDRIIIDGQDGNGAERTLTLVFQSVSLQDERKPG